MTTVTQPGAPRPRESPYGPDVGKGSLECLLAWMASSWGPHHAGHQSVLLNEIEPHVQVVPHAQFPDIELTGFLERLKTMERRSAG